MAFAQEAYAQAGLPAAEAKVAAAALAT